MLSAKPLLLPCSRGHVSGYSVGLPIMTGNSSDYRYLPKGISDFAELRTRAMIYVDKTAYLGRMLEMEKYVFLARPRRFGKTLLLSTLKHLFDRNRNGDLFQDTAIHRSRLWDHLDPGPVLTLDMSRAGITDPQDVETGLRRVVQRSCLNAGLEPPPREQPAHEALDDAIYRLYQSTGQRVAVLVDEYDAPVTGLWENSDTLSTTDYSHTMKRLREFYRILKICDDQLRFVFITGIVRIEQAGLFSALNNLTDISANPVYHGICGFTETEIGQYLGRHVEIGAHHYGCSAADMEKLLRAHYNGYLFAFHHEPVCNPHSLLHVLDALGHEASIQPVRVRGFPSPWFQAGIPFFLFQYLKNCRYDIQAMRHDWQVIETTLDLQAPDVESLLFQTGFLTLKSHSDGQFYLDYPNREVETGFREGLLLVWLNRQPAEKQQVLAVFEEMRRYILEGDYHGACNCFNRLLDGMPYDLLKTESHYQAILHATCMFMSGVKVSSEGHTRYGRMDTVLETPDTFVIIELKLNRTAREGYDQVADMEYPKAYTGQDKKVVWFGLNFNTPRGQGDRWDASRENWDIYYLLGDSSLRAGAGGL